MAIEEVTSVGWEHAGVWTCVISQEELGLQWTAAWIHVQGVCAKEILTSVGTVYQASSAAWQSRGRWPFGA